jgi:hypothetical protein
MFAGEYRASSYEQSLLIDRRKGEFGMEFLNTI